MDRTYINAELIAKTLNVSKDTAYRLLKTPGCPSIKVGGRVIVESSKFFEWLDLYEGREIVLK